MKVCKSLTILTLFLMLFGVVYAQESSDVSGLSTSDFSEESEEDSPTPDFGFGLAFGNETLNGTNYNTISLQPDFALGKFGVGLDLNIAFDADGNIRKSDWETWQDILSKITYLRWGLKGDKPVYVKIGNIDDFTLGHGLVMYRYSNMLNYPAVRTLGLAFDLDLDMFGMESVIGSLRFDVMGFRMYFRPLLNLPIPIVKTLEVGGTLAMDLDPYSLVTNVVDSTNTYVYGMDLGMIVLDNVAVSMISYLDLVFIDGAGSGYILGVAGDIFTYVPYKLEIRYNQPRFMYTYFNSFYDGEKMLKYASLDAVSNSSAGMLFSSGVGFLPDDDGVNQITWTFAIEDSFIDEVKPTLLMELYLAHTLLKKVGATFTWAKKDIEDFKDAFSFESENSILMLDLAYYISESLSLNINYKRTFEVDANGVIQPFTSTSISTSFDFF